MEYHLAIDIGASSGRHILGHLRDGKFVLEEIYRFENIPLQKNGHLCWDIESLWDSVLAGLRACADAGKIPATVGIDTWAVDFILLDSLGNRVGDAVSYRDGRTAGLDRHVESVIPFPELYARTGIQKQPFNTIYQLMSLKRDRPKQLQKADFLLMIPDYLNFLLTGVKKQEYTNATTTSLVNAKTKTWDMELIDALGLPRHLFGPLSLPGTVAGSFSEDIAKSVGFSSVVILPATHDTGSAFLAVPAKDDDSVYISSGTWSLLGVESPIPYTSEKSRENNFTNEGGYAYRFRYLKNIMGLWMIQSIRRELNDGRAQKLTFDDLCMDAEVSASFPSVVDVNDLSFLAPESMIEAVKDFCRKSGQPVPETTGELMQCVYVSLAECYTSAVKQLSSLTGRTYRSINIVGGGSLDGYLNRLTAARSGLPVYAGPTEATALGNLAVQMIHSGKLRGIAAARECIRNSFDIKLFNSKEN